MKGPRPGALDASGGWRSPATINRARGLLRTHDASLLRLALALDDADRFFFEAKLDGQELPEDYTAEIVERCEDAHFTTSLYLPDQLPMPGAWCEGNVTD